MNSINSTTAIKQIFEEKIKDAGRPHSDTASLKEPPPVPEQHTRLLKNKFEQKMEECLVSTRKSTMPSKSASLDSPRYSSPRNSELDLSFPCFMSPRDKESTLAIENNENSPSGNNNEFSDVDLSDAPDDEVVKIEDTANSDNPNVDEILNVDESVNLDLERPSFEDIPDEDELPPIEMEIDLTQGAEEEEEEEEDEEKEAVTPRADSPKRTFTRSSSMIVPPKSPDSEESLGSKLLNIKNHTPKLPEKGSPRSALSRFSRSFNKDGHKSSNRYSTDFSETQESNRENVFGFLTIVEEQNEENEVLDYSEEGIVYLVTPKDGVLIKSATLEKLIEKLTDSTFRESSFETTFIHTFHYYCTPKKFLQMLSERWDLVPEVDAVWKNETLLSNRIKICSVLKNWFDMRFQLDLQTDESLGKDVLNLIDSKIAKTKGLESHAQVLRKLVKTNLKRPEKKPSKKDKSERRKRKQQANKNFLEFNCKELAQQLTLREIKLLKSISLSEFFNQAWMKNDKAERTPNLLAFTHHFNKISMWVATMVLAQRNWRKRADTIEHFIKLLEELVKLRNFNGGHEILAGLLLSPIARLKHTWEEISEKSMKTFESINLLLSPKKNYKAEREQLEQGTCIPFLGMFLSDLVFIEEGNPTFIGDDKDFVNFSKCRKLGKIFARIQSLQASDYSHLTSVTSMRQFLNSLESYPEKTLYDLSYNIFPRGSTKTEKEIEKEEIEREAEQEVCVCLEKEEGERKDVILHSYMTVKQAKEKICNLKWSVKLNPADMSLFLPHKDFQKYGGLRLDRSRTIGSYRLKKGYILILKKKGIGRNKARALSMFPVPCTGGNGQPNSNNQSTSLITVYSPSHGHRTSIKLNPNTTAGDIILALVKKTREPPEQFNLYYQDANTKEYHKLSRTKPISYYRLHRPNLVLRKSQKEKTQSMLSLAELARGRPLSSAELDDLNLRKKASLHLLKSSSRDGELETPAWLKQIRENSSSVTELDLSLKTASKRHLLILAQILASNSRITNVDLTNCGVGDSVISALAESLKTNNTLTYINLKGNELTKTSAIALEQALTKHNFSLIELDLDESITNEHVNKIRKALRSNKSLMKCQSEEKTDLNFSNRSLSLIPLLIFSLTKLVTLDLSFNSLSFVSPQIERLSLLEDLNLANNHLSSLPVEILALKRLRVLNLKSNQFSKFPNVLGLLDQLEVLNIESNQINTIPSVIGTVASLHTLQVNDNPLEPNFIITPTLIKQGGSQILATFKDMLGGASTLVNCINIVVFGERRVGKTTLARCLHFGARWIEEIAKTRSIAVPEERQAQAAIPLENAIGSTDVNQAMATKDSSLNSISVYKSNMALGKKDIAFYIWDFPHDENLKALIPYFGLGKDCIFLYLFQMGDSRGLHDLRPALEFIKHYPLILVGTHLDKCSKQMKQFQVDTISELVKVYQRDLPGIRHSCCVSSETGEGCDSLLGFLLRTSLEVGGPYMNKMIPRNYLALESKLISTKDCFSGKKTIPWAEFCSNCKQCFVEDLPDVLVMLQKHGIIYYYADIEKRIPLNPDKVFLVLKYAWQQSSQQKRGSSYELEHQQ